MADPPDEPIQSFFSEDDFEAPENAERYRPQPRARAYGVEGEIPFPRPHISWLGAEEDSISETEGNPVSGD